MGFLEIVCRLHIYSVNSRCINCFISWLHGINEVLQVPVRIHVSSVAARARIDPSFPSICPCVDSQTLECLSSYPENELVSSYL